MFKKHQTSLLHNFVVQWYSTKSKSLVQLLYCRTCKKRFWGFGGQLKKPDFLHEVKHNFVVNPLKSPTVIEKIGTYGGKNE